MTPVQRPTSSSIDVDTIIATLKEILVDDLNVAVPISQIDENASLEDELNVDSVVLVELISAIEIRFDFVFLDSDLVTSSFVNLSALAGVIAERIRASEDVR